MVVAGAWITVVVKITDEAVLGDVDRELLGGGTPVLAVTVPENADTSGVSVAGCAVSVAVSDWPMIEGSRT